MVVATRRKNAHAAPVGTGAPVWKQGTTWAGVFNIGIALATGGVASLADPLVIAQICSGIALILAKE